METSLLNGFKEFTFTHKKILNKTANMQKFDNQANISYSKGLSQNLEQWHSKEKGTKM